MKIVGRFAFLQAALLLFTFVAVFAVLAHSQQEIAPEHYDVKSVPHAKGKQTAHASPGAPGRTLTLSRLPRERTKGTRALRKSGWGKQKAPVRPTATAQANNHEIKRKEGKKGGAEYVTENVIRTDL